MRIIEDPRNRMQRFENPYECWLLCDECSRFFQYKNAHSWGGHEHDACPFADCTGFGLGFHLFLWDDLREADDPRWPSSPDELAHGMRSPDPEVFHEERRARLASAFAQSPEWAQSGAGDEVRYLQPLLSMLSDACCDLAGGGAMPADSVDLEFLSGLPIYSKTSDIAEAPRMVTELRAFFRFAARTGAAAEPEPWLSLLSERDAAEQGLREAIERYAALLEHRGTARRRRRKVERRQDKARRSQRRRERQARRAARR